MPRRRSEQAQMLFQIAQLQTALETTEANLQELTHYNALLISHAAQLNEALARANEEADQLRHELGVRVASLPGTLPELVAAYYRNANIIDDLLAQRDSVHFDRQREVSALLEENRALRLDNQALHAQLAELPTPEGTETTTPVFRSTLFATAFRREVGTQTEPAANSSLPRNRR